MQFTKHNSPQMEDDRVGRITDTRNEEYLRAIKYRCHDTETITCIKEAVNSSLEGWTTSVLPERSPELTFAIHLDKDIPVLYVNDRLVQPRHFVAINFSLNCIG